MKQLPAETETKDCECCTYRTYCREYGHPHLVDQTVWMCTFCANTYLAQLILWRSTSQELIWLAKSVAIIANMFNDKLDVPYA